MGVYFRDDVPLTLDWGALGERSLLVERTINAAIKSTQKFASFGVFIIEIRFLASSTKISIRKGYIVGIVPSF